MTKLFKHSDDDKDMSTFWIREGLVPILIQLTMHKATRHSPKKIDLYFYWKDLFEFKIVLGIGSRKYSDDIASVAKLLKWN